MQEQEETEEYSLFHLGPADKGPLYKVMLDVDGQLVTTEIDTVAALSLMSEATFKELWLERISDHSSVQLCSYSEEKIPVVGQTEVAITYKEQEV